MRHKNFWKWRFDRKFPHHSLWQEFKRSSSFFEISSSVMTRPYVTRSSPPPRLCWTCFSKQGLQWWRWMTKSTTKILRKRLTLRLARASRPCGASPSPCAGRRVHSIWPRCTHCRSHGPSCRSSSTPAGEPQSGSRGGRGRG